MEQARRRSEERAQDLQRRGHRGAAANIRADGYRLLQNLVVRKGDKKDRYFVVAGGRRLAALNLLAEAGEIAKDYPAECKEREGEIATEISLAENVMREEMHPVDQYEAFDALAKQGKDIADLPRGSARPKPWSASGWLSPAFRRSFCSSSAATT
ncbi:ParB/Srx family N-terminal domain-containing protein [Sinorhizobium meliloti]|uniref:ParB/Srx family N-terminal domain-containing protein n=1 Tax=Rhizobium meliloti TaxID=382 RepID=UPI003F5CE690